jgi:hypothetical protein
MKTMVSHQRIIRRAVFAVLVFVCPAQAAVVYEQPPGLALPTITGHSSSACGDFCIPYETADDFLLPAPTRITHIQFWGFPIVGPHDTFAVSFYTLTNGFPEFGEPFVLNLEHSTTALLRSRTPEETVTPTNEDVFRYEVELEDFFDAEANTTYWMAVFNTGPSLWKWLFSPLAGEVAQRNLTPALPYPPQPGNLPWTLARPDAAFRLVSQPVPEPAAVMLLAVGFTASLLIRRRRR